MKTWLVVAIGLAGLVASSAWAEEAAPRLREIEKGPSVALEAGGMRLFGQGAWGRTLGLSASFGLGDRLSLGILALGLQIDAPDGWRGSDGRRGDGSGIVAATYLEGALRRWEDARGLDRLSLTGRLGGGVGWFGPEGAFDGTIPVAFGGLGVEYFTHLRHFSLGAQLDLIAGGGQFGFGLMAAPFLRYTFDG